MKKLCFLLFACLLACNPSTKKADSSSAPKTTIANDVENDQIIDTIDASETVIDMRSYCKSGKINIFIISVHGCDVCKASKEELLQKNYDKEKIHIFYCMVTKNENDATSHSFENRPSNKMWGYMEGCTSPPYFYMFGPSGNPLSITEHDVEKVFTNTEELLKSWNYYNSNLVKKKMK